MRVMFDLNIILDVLQLRHPWAEASGKLCAAAVRGEVEGFVASHAITTLFYIVEKHAGREIAEKDIDWVLASFSAAPADRQVFLRARSLPLKDFEDAVVVASAEAAHCNVIATRNIADFHGAPIPAFTPEELLSAYGQQTTTK